MLLQGWFYLTPIVYPLSLVPERFGKYLALNPLTPLVTLYREALLGGTMPPLGTLMPLVDHIGARSGDRHRGLPAPETGLRGRDLRAA